MKVKLKPKRIALVCLMLAISFLARAQSKTVSGVVTAANGDALEGVNVTLQNGSTGTITDKNGRYSLSVPSGNSVLTFSYTGHFTQAVNVKNRSVIDLALVTDPKSLSEVVVTSLGIKKEKRALGYSIQEVEGSKLSVAKETNVINSLKGRVAGVHINSSSAGPAGSVYIAIRGNSSLAGNNQPLFVVDGVPINNDNIQQASNFGGRDFGDGIKDINPDDIESVSVLKGPNAAALYGSRGANGVVLITTKKGTKKGVGINFNTNATYETPNSVPTFQNTWGMGYDDNFDTWGKVTIDGKEYLQQSSWMYDNWGGKMDGQLVGIQTMPDLGLVPLKGQPIDNIAKFYRTGETYTNTLSLTSSSDKINFRSSISNLSNRGIVPNNSFDRQTINMLVGANVTDKLYVEAKANYIRQYTKNRPYIGDNRRNIASSLNNAARHIDLAWLEDYKNPDGSMKTYNGNGGFPLNPYWILNEFSNNDKRDRLIGYVSANYKFTNWLSLNLRSGTDMYTDSRFEREGIKSPTNFGGYVSNVQYHVNETNSDALLTASGNIARNFTGTLSAGANHYTKRYEASGASGNNLDVEGIYTVTNAKTQFGIYDLVRKQINSVYASGQIGYKNYLFLDMAARNDWSSTLSKENYSFFYPSISLSYIITDALNISSNILNYAKLRASWAQAGSDASPYLTKAGYSVYTTGFNGQSFAWISGNIPATNLKNELKTSWEIGTELRLLKNRMSVDFTYYDASTKDQIMLVQIPTPTGFSNKLVNSGEVTNKGIELFVSGRPLQMKNSLSWDISVNLSNNKSKIVSLYPGIETHLLYGVPEAAIEARPGEPYGNIVGYKFLRTDDGQLLLNADGIIQRDNERQILGNIQPRWLAGFTNTFSFKGFVLSGLVDVRNGGQIYSMSKYSQMARGTGKFTEKGDNLINEGVISDGNGGFGKSTKVLPRQAYYAMQAWSGSSEPFVLSASYVALREVTFGYDFKLSLLSKIKLTSARLSIVGRNLIYFYRDPSFKTMGISPESAFAPTANAQGYEAASMPTTRSIGFNLSIGF
jgi:TonB-linked SusC/RagA family outer membrane protein